MSDVIVVRGIGSKVRVSSRTPVIHAVSEPTVIRINTGTMGPKGESGQPNVFVGPTAPVTDLTEYLWVDTSNPDEPRLWFKEPT